MCIYSSCVDFYSGRRRRFEVSSPVLFFFITRAGWPELRFGSASFCFILDPRALLFCACLASRFKPADAVKRGLWGRECFYFYSCCDVLRMRHGMTEIKNKDDLIKSIYFVHTGKGSTGYILL